MISGQKALDLLREGNRRFAAGEPRAVAAAIAGADPARRTELVFGRHPFAIILGCSDSRAAPEIVFDQGLGELFVVRVAGSVAGPTQIASVEFAAEQFGSRLVLVLGHSRCGAVMATVDHLAAPPDATAAEASADPGPIIELIAPIVEALRETDSGSDREGLVRRAVRANAEASIKRLRGSKVLARLAAEDGLVVAGAEHALETGEVEFFDLESSG